MRLLDKVKKKVEEDNGEVFHAAILMLAMAVALVFLLDIITSVEGNGSKKENEYISEFYEGKVVENITRNEIKGVNWNKKVEFTDGEIAYVQISCEVVNQEEIDNSKEAVKKEYECNLKEIGKVSDEQPDNDEIENKTDEVKDNGVEREHKNSNEKDDESEN